MLLYYNICRVLNINIHNTYIHIYIYIYIYIYIFMSYISVSSKPSMTQYSKACKKPKHNS